MSTESTSLILDGNGYSLTVSAEAEQRKLELIALSQLVLSVESNDDSYAAQRVTRSLGQMRIEVVKSHKLAKEPVNRMGKLIDKIAKDFVASIEGEEKRIHLLVGDHAQRVARAKAELEDKERKSFEVARMAREAAEAAVIAASETRSIGDVIAAKRAESARDEALMDRRTASEETASTNIAKGVRFATDFEVTDVNLLADTRRDLVTVTPSRMAIMKMLKDLDDSGVDIIQAGKEIGILVYKKTVVATR